MCDLVQNGLKYAFICSWNNQKPSLRFRLPWGHKPWRNNKSNWKWKKLEEQKDNKMFKSTKCVCFFYKNAFSFCYITCKFPIIFPISVFTTSLPECHQHNFAQILLEKNVSISYWPPIWDIKMRVQSVEYQNFYSRLATSCF